jgi:type II secretory pathway component GspD/PulD (secretin)
VNPIGMIFNHSLSRTAGLILAGVLLLAYPVHRVPAQDDLQNDSPGASDDAPGETHEAIIEFLDLPHTEITEILKILGDAANWTVIPSREIKGQVSVFLRNIGTEEALERILEINGYRFVRDGNVISVMTEQDYELKVGPRTEQRTFDLRYAEAARLAPLIQGALSSRGRVVPDTENNQLVVFDLPNRFPALGELIASLDQRQETRVIALNHATVKDLQTSIQSLVTDPRNLRFDERTNRLIVTDTPSRLDYLEDVIRQLDLEDLTETRTYVLKHANVDEMADLVATVIGGDDAGSRSSSGSGSRSSGSSDGGAFGTSTAEGESGPSAREIAAMQDRTRRYEDRSIAPGLERRSIDGSEIVAGGSGSSASVVAQGGDSGSGGGGVARSLGGQGMVIADPRTSSIIVTHTPAVLNRLETIITALDRETEFHTYQFQHADLETLDVSGHLDGLLDGEAENFQIDTNTGMVIFQAPSEKADRIKWLLQRWDVPPRQVEIEARILRVSLDLVRKLGTTIQIADFNAEGELETVIDLLFPPTEVGPDTVPQGLIQFGNLETDEFTAIIQAIETEGLGNLLSNPKLAVIDRSPARFQVAVDQPFVEVVTDANSDVTRESTRFIPVGVILEVLPVITDSGLVKMEVRVEVSTLLGRSTNGAPIVDRSEASSVVLVEDQHTLVIGGLIVDEEIETVNKVPWLGDIPLLKYLFRNSVRDVQKSELVLFLTPRITGTGSPEPPPPHLHLD